MFSIAQLCMINAFHRDAFREREKISTNLTRSSIIEWKFALFDVDKAIILAISVSHYASLQGFESI